MCKIGRSVLFVCALQERHLNVSEIPHNIQNQKVRQQFMVGSSAHSKVFLPVLFVQRLNPRKHNDTAVSSAQHGGPLTQKEKKNVNVDPVKEGNCKSGGNGPPSKSHGYESISGHPMDNILMYVMDTIKPCYYVCGVLFF